jgi:hypothetical protein
LEPEKSGQRRKLRRSKTEVLKNANIKKPRSRKPERPVWTLEDGTTYSSLSTFLDCPEQFALKYVDGYTRSSLSVPLEYGSLMHAAIERQFDGLSPKELIGQLGDKYLSFRLGTLPNPSDRDRLKKLVEVAKVTFPAYCEYWEEDDAKLTWIKREAQFNVPYKLVMPDGKVEVIRLRGMRDGVYRQPKSGELAVFETKNKSRISEQEIIDGLKADMQTLLYILATEIELKETPTAVKYNVIRRGDDLYQRKEETLGSYSDRLAEDIKKRPEHYFMRFHVTIDRNDIDSFKQYTLDPLLRRFVQWWESVKKNPMGRDRFKSPFHYQNCNALIGKYGKCDMWEGIVNGNFRTYKLRSEPFPELSENIPALD